MRLDELRWDEAEEYLKRDDRIALPMGSTEQHGSRGVLGTDALIAEAMADEVARRTNTLSAPYVCYGVSPFHMGFPGTVSLRPATFIETIKDILRCFHHHGFRRVLIVNGHGGNTAPTQCALQEICNELFDLKVQFQSWWECEEIEKLSKKLFADKDGTHGCPTEVSVTMFIKPDVKFLPSVPINPAHETPFYKNWRTVRETLPYGLFGGADPNLASAEHGKLIFDAAVSAISKRMERWE